MAALVLAVPVAVPPSTASIAITETRRDVVCPFVVIVEFAQRSTALLVSETSTTRPTPSAPPGRASTRSTISWAVNVFTHPPAGC